MKKNVVIAVLVLVIVVLGWMALGRQSEVSVTISRPAATSVAKEKPKSAPESAAVVTQAPIAPKVETVDDRLAALGFKPSSQVHPMSLRPVGAKTDSAK